MNAANRQESLRIAYADPPYPGRAHLYPENQEVDHADLIARLCEYDGWALSTNSPALSYVLGLCPNDVCVAAWVRPNSMPFNPDRRGAVRSWEPVIYSPARCPVDDPTRVRDVLSLALPNGYNKRRLVGSKPRGFGAWLFGLLGATPGDVFDDLFPGSGGISREWIEWDMQPHLFAAAIGGQGMSWELRHRIERRHPMIDGMAAGSESVL